MTDSSPLDLVALISSLTESDENLIWINTSSRPLDIDRLGSAVADTVADLHPQAIVCWHDPDEVVFAHTVARALDVPVVRLDRELGLLSLDPPLATGVDRVLVLGTAWTGSRPLGTLVSLLNNLGVGIVSVLSLLPGDPRPESLPEATPFRVFSAS